MKIEKINFEGKKASIEVLDKIFSAKINKKLISNVIYKINANYKGRKAKTKQKMRQLDLLLKFMHKKAQEMQDMQVEKLQFLLAEVQLMVQKENCLIRKEKLIKVKKNKVQHL